METTSIKMSGENTETCADSLAKWDIRLMDMIRLKEQENEKLNKKITRFEILNRRKTNQHKEELNNNHQLHVEMDALETIKDMEKDP